MGGNYFLLTVRMKKFVTTFLTATLALSGMSTAFAAAGVRVGGVMMTSDRTIVANAMKAPILTTLVAAVKAADLAETLAGEGPYTVFAPTDMAFRAVRAKVDRMMDMDDKADLKAVLTFHVVAGQYMAADLKNGMTLTSVQGEKLTIKKVGRNIWVNNARIQTRDVMASNGVVHVINKVLMPSMKPVKSSSSSSVSRSSSSTMSSSSAMSTSSMSSSSVSSSSSVMSASSSSITSSSAAVPTAWAKAKGNMWQDKGGRWLKTDLGKVLFKNSYDTWSPLANWQWQGEDGAWYKFETDWTLVWSKDGVKWVEVPTGTWPGKMGYWYKLDVDGSIWWMSDGTWKMSEGGMWQDKRGDWFKVSEGRVMSSTNGTLWTEVPGWQWLAMDGNWYRFDKSWKVWTSATGTVWAEVPSMTWKGKDGETLMLDAQGMLWVKN